VNQRNFLSAIWAAVLAHLFPKRAIALPAVEETPDRIEIRTDETWSPGGGRNGFIVRSFYDSKGPRRGVETMIVVTHHDAEVLVSRYVSGTPVPKRTWLQRLRYRWSPPREQRCGRIV
jgi:hypothetical protein